LTLSLPEAEIFIMNNDNLFIQVLTREGNSGKERETKRGWREHPLTVTG